MLTLSFKAVAAVLGLIAAAVMGVTLLFTVNQPGGTMVLLLGLSPSELAAPSAINSCANQAIDKAVRDGMTVYVAPVGRASSAEWKPTATKLSTAAKSNLKRA